MGTDNSSRRRPLAKTTRTTKPVSEDAPASARAFNPFELFVAPATVVSQMDGSRQLASMRSRVHRPLDKPSPSTRPHWMTESIDEALLRPDPIGGQGGADESEN